MHHGLHVGSSVAIVDNLKLHLGAVHGSKPCDPVSLAATRRASTIAVAPAKVIGTNHSIFCVICLTEHCNEVVPVVGTTGVVGEVDGADLMSLHLNIRRVCTPPACRTVGSTQFVIEYQVASVDSEAEVEVIRINGVDAVILLGIDVAVGTVHHSFHVGCAIAVIGDISRHLSTVHGSTPGSPTFIVSLATY